MKTWSFLKQFRFYINSNDIARFKWFKLLGFYLASVVSTGFFKDPTGKELP